MRHNAPLLRRKLLGWLLGPLVLLFLSGGTAGYFIAHDLANDVYNRQLLEIANELSLHVVGEDGSMSLELPAAARHLLLADPSDKIFYRISAGDGRFITGDPTLPLPSHFSRETTTPRFYRSYEHDKPVWIALMRSAESHATGSPTFLVQVGETTTKRDAFVHKILLSIVLPQFLLILVAALLVRFGVAQGLLPLRRLRQAVENRSHLDLSPIGEEDVPGEVRPLLHAVNALMVRLNEVLSFQARFIADAAHQLRTPVAGLKTNIELALRETDLSDLKRSLSQTYVSVDRLSRLVSQLLSLARNEPNTARVLHFSALDLSKLILNTTKEWVPEAYKKGIDLGFDGPEHPVLIEGDVTRLTELANNLLDNAIRYTRSAGRVTARVLAEPQPAFSVSDDGPRIPPEERERIFERFHRLLGTPTDGSGLGLAIVREIATIHGARVDLTDDADGVGNRFTITVPLPGSTGDGSEPRARSGEFA
jgi:two-component system sensor histidine kinase TctE